MTTKGVRYSVTVEAAQANAELRRLNQSATTMAGAEKQAAAATDMANAALGRKPAVAKAAAFSMNTLTQQANKFSQVMGKQAAAIALISANLGEQNGKMGEVIKSAGTMAAAFGAGGPWALALVGGIALVGQLAKHWDNVIEAQRRAQDLQFSAVDRASQMRFEETRKLADLQDKLDPDNAAAEKLAALQERAIDMRKQALAVEQETAKLRVGQIQTDLERAAAEEKAGFRGATAQREALEAQLASIDAGKVEANLLRETAALIDKQVTVTQKLAEARKEGDKPPARTATPIDEDNTFSGPSMNDLKKQWQQKQAAKLEVIAQNEQMEREAHGRYLAWVEEKEQQHADKLKAIREETAQHHADLAMQSAAIVSGASMQLVGDLISAQELALERFGVSIMAQAGQALVSYGTQAFGASALSLSLGNLPAAGVQAATGAALTGAGIGLGGAAIGLGNLMGTGMSMTTSRQLPGAGVSGGFGGSGGGTVIQITYGGASGPTADHGARAVAMASDRAQRRQEQAGPAWR